MMSLIKCWECGHDVSTEATNCPNCGAPVKKIMETQTPTSKGVQDKRGKSGNTLRKSIGLKRAFLLIIIASFVLWFLVKIGTSLSDKQGSTETSDSSTAKNYEKENFIDNQRTSHNSANNQKGLQSQNEIILSPYELFKNPFQQKNNRVKLNPLVVPVLLNEQLISWVPGNQIIGQVGIRFDRMLSKNQALYDIMAMDSQAHYRDSLQTVGQMLIILGMTQDTHSQSSGPLTYNKFWEVEPLGTVSGTNMLGARISIPAVKFIGYESEADSSARIEATRRAFEKERAEISARMEAARRAKEKERAEREAKNAQIKAQQEAKRQKEQEEFEKRNQEEYQKDWCRHQSLLYRGGKKYIPTPECEKYFSPQYEKVPHTKIQDDKTASNKTDAHTEFNEAVTAYTNYLIPLTYNQKVYNCSHFQESTKLNDFQKAAFHKACENTGMTQKQSTSQQSIYDQYNP